MGYPRCLIGPFPNILAFASSLDVLVQDLQLEKGGREHEHVATSLIDPVETATLEKIVYDNEGETAAAPLLFDVLSQVVFISLVLLGANDVVETENSASSLDVTTLVKRQMVILVIFHYASRLNCLCKIPFLI